MNNSETLSESNDIIEVFKRHCKETPDSLFTIDEHNRSYTYGEADFISDKVCIYLKNHNIRKEDFIVSTLSRNALTVIAMLGILKAEAAFVCLDSDYASMRVEYIKNDCNAKMIMNDALLNSILEDTSLDNLTAELSISIPDMHSIACAFYTSGSTGTPKGVIYERGKFPLIYRSTFVRNLPLFSKDTRFGLIPPFYFIASWIFHIGVLYAGGSVFVFDKDTIYNPISLKKLIISQNLNSIFMTASVIKLIHYNLPKCIQTVITGGESADGLYLPDKRLLSCYGMTESGFGICMSEITQKSDKIIYNHPSIPIDLRLSEGTEGEIIFTNLYTRGYINLPELNSRHFINGEFHTGDYGRMLKDGHLIHRGRLDGMVKINGNRIDISEIENCMQKITGLDNVAARAVSINKINTSIIAYYINDTDIDVKKLRNEMMEHLPDYMIPSGFIRVSSFPFTESGKLKRNELPVPDYSLMSTEDEAPRNNLEIKLHSAMCSVLGLKKISINDDFYSIGGDSLTAIKVIEKAKLFSLSVSDILKYRTIKDIIAEYEKKLGDVKTDKLLQYSEYTSGLKHMLTDEQLYVIDYQCYSPTSTMYALPFLFKLKDDIDMDLFRNALMNLSQIHTVFLTEIRLNEDGYFYQCYNDSLFKLPEIEIMSSSEFEAFIEAPVPALKRLVNCPLYIMRIIRTDSGMYFYICFHHIMCDGTSYSVFMKDLVKLYNGTVLPKDFYYFYLMEQKEKSELATYKNSCEYFERRFKNHDFIKHLHFDFNTRENNNNNFTLNLEIDKDNYFDNNKYDLTPNGFFILVALLSLSIIENRDEVAVSWIYSGRDEAYKSNIIGLLIKMLPALIHFNSKMNTYNMAKLIRMEIEEGIEHCDYPYITKTSPVVCEDYFCVIYQDELRNLPENHDILFEKQISLPSVATASQSLLDIEILNKDNRLVAFFDYNSSLYKESSIRHFSEVFKKICHILLENQNNTLTYNDIKNLLD